MTTAGLEPQLVVLDVGHGNAALLTAGGKRVVLDCGPDYSLHAFLQSEGIQHIDVIMVSHSHADHVKGLIVVLNDDAIVVDTVYINPDQVNNRRVWEDVCVVIKRARARGTKLVTALTQDMPGDLALGDVAVEVVYPFPEDVMARSAPNPQSAVIRILSAQGGEAVLTGDIDSSSLDAIVGEGRNLRGHLLVFPHHGGWPDRSDPQTFASRLCGLVDPHVVVFSIGRDRFDNPLKEVVRGVREAAPAAHIACTQLNAECGAADRQPPHLSARYAAGRAQNQTKCCMGTLTLHIATRRLTPALAAHRSFVNSLPVGIEGGPRCRDGQSTAIQPA